MKQDSLSPIAETELRLEEQDLRILKTLLTDPLTAIDFANTYDEKLFMGDARWFARSALAYIKAYRALPTKRVMLEHFSTDAEKKISVGEVWDSVVASDSDPAEFKYDLDKIKNRFGETKRQSIKELLDSPIELNQLLKKIKEETDAIEQIKKGQRQAYTQKTLKSYMPEFKQSYNDKYHNKDLGRGILTGYSFFDYVKNGMSPAELLIITAESGAGKAQPLDTQIATPSGFKKLGDIHPGDTIFGQDGKPCQVLAENDVIVAVGWKFIFNDHTEVVSHENHLWLTFDRQDRIALSKRTPEFRAKRRAKRKEISLNDSNKERWRVPPPPPSPLPPPTGSIKSTKEIVETLSVQKERIKNHAFPICEALELPKKNLPIDSYVLGTWLGDGSKDGGAVTSMDKEIIDYIVGAGEHHLSTTKNKINKDGSINKALTYRFTGLTARLRSIGVLKNKHIPQEYLWASKEQRLALLQGLMDTDGSADKKGAIDFVNTNKAIIDGLEFIINSLGEKCTVTEGRSMLYGIDKGPKWTIRFCPSFPAFRLKRKLERQQLSPVRLNKFRILVKVEKVDAVPMKCIQVSSPDHMYLTGKNLIPTHNSMLLNNMAIQMWMQKNTVYTDPQSFAKGYNVLYFSLEMPYESCARRTLACVADIPNYGIRDSNLSKFQLQSLNRVSSFIDKYPYEFEIVDIPRGVSAEQIELRFQEACARYHPDVVVVDYLGLMEDPMAEGEDWLKLGYIAGKLHELARVYNIVMLTAVQSNRTSNKVKQDPSEAIGLHRIGRSSLIMHHANVAIQIESRKDEHTFSDLRYHVIKNRDGELGMHVLQKNFANASLKDMDPPFEPKRDESGVIILGHDVEDISDLLMKHNWGRK